ncbi:histone acetyltransferase type B catalytic subunit [Chrysoperla carnea]|uniref:histone acetyltransferase type B catalytic subunit n=1 Tax=Chrysoperla carnea TaxID=189513 RepID=UPI001D065A72|nr:histone acetyltransferase type B catalytic subunit [Chrysoperla carnea]
MACQSNGVSTTDCKIKFTINLVRDKEDLDDDNADFPPGIVPRVIEAFNGDTGDVIPRISLSFWSSSLKTLISTNIDGNQEIDKIIMDLNEDLPINYHNQRNDFLTLYEEEFATHFKPHGKMIQVFDRKVNGKMRVFEIYFSDFANADESFKEYHRRMESFALLCIDGAVRITVDPRWCIFTIYEVQKTPKLRYHFVGFSTVYRFHSFPDKIRPRISQFVIIPPFQRCGIGKQLLRVEQNYLIDTFNILEITVEEPCEAFYEMRDIVDAERILTSYPSFVPQILDSKPSSKKAVTNEFHKRLFIPNKRVVHMYELVKLYCILKSDPSKIEELQKEIEGRIKSQRMNDTNFLTQKQRRHGLRSHEEFLGRPAISLNDIEEQFKGLFIKYENVVEKLISSEPEWNTSKEP